MGREEVQRHVAPVIALLRIELVDREKLDDCDAQILKVRNLLGHTGKRAAFRCGDPGVRARGESFDMQFVDDGIPAAVSGARLGEIGTHGFTEGCEKGSLAEALEKLEAFELVLDRILHLGETQLDPSGVQRVVELADSVGCGDVDACDGLCRDDEPADGRR